MKELKERIVLALPVVSITNKDDVVAALAKAVTAEGIASDVAFALATGWWEDMLAQDVPPDSESMDWRCEYLAIRATEWLKSSVG